MNFLFICSKNQWRSPTAERIFKDYANLNTRSAGTSRQAKKPVSANDIVWADKIFVMEHKHKQQIQAMFRQELKFKETIVLDISDDYHYMDAELIEILQQSMQGYLDNLDG
ncbi:MULTISPECIES: low molecular weight protein tyrosine phosphatase family protein [unclassified Acinetobacter]|uniref:low molecular weight protein tyrosine phosphatase family protein n=1 Tax=unclassified Acinetobacter TaxID=196816 RepID=UPI0035B7078D